MTDMMGRTMTLSPAETLLLGHDALTRLSTVGNDFLGKLLVRHVLDAMDYEPHRAGLDGSANSPDTGSMRPPG